MSFLMSLCRGAAMARGFQVTSSSILHIIVAATPSDPPDVNFCRVYFTYPFGKQPRKNIWKGKSHLKKTGEVIGWLFCDIFKADRSVNSLRLPIAATGDTWCVPPPCDEEGSKAFKVDLCLSDEGAKYKIQLIRLQEKKIHFAVYRARVEREVTRLLCGWFLSFLFTNQTGLRSCSCANLLFFPSLGIAGALPLPTLSIKSKQKETDTVAY